MKARPHPAAEAWSYRLRKIRAAMTPDRCPVAMKWTILPPISSALPSVRIRSSRVARVECRAAPTASGPSIRRLRPAGSGGFGGGRLRPGLGGGAVGAEADVVGAEGPGGPVGVPVGEELQVAVDRGLLAAADGDLPGVAVEPGRAGAGLGGLVAAVDVDLVVGDRPALPVDPVAELVEVALAVDAEEGGVGVVGGEDRVAGGDVGDGQLGLAGGALELGEAAGQPGGDLAEADLDRPGRPAPGQAVAVDQGPAGGDRGVVDVEVEPSGRRRRRPGRRRPGAGSP